MVETEDSFRVAPENFLAEGEKQMLEKILKVPHWDLIGNHSFFFIGESSPFMAEFTQIYVVFYPVVNGGSDQRKVPGVFIFPIT